ncbi:MAG: PHP domain-containing protein [Candidatus Heimdallarchaeota archaeon]|nr:MAG: PHP domain-containing protein [Candidatus Heimdallarchaeota archaeon]
MDDLTKVDFHSHTYYSLLRVPVLRSNRLFQDSAISPKLLIKIARNRRLGAIALTDHDNMNGIKPFLSYASKFDDIIPIVGQEITKYNQKRKGWAHVLTYGLREIPWKIRFQPLPEFLDYLDDNNAVYVLAHPFDLSQSAPAGGLHPKTYEINFSVLKRFRMIETINGLQSKRYNLITQFIAHNLKIPGIAGGDSHNPKMIGKCYTYIEGTTEEEILECLHQVKKSPEKYSLRSSGEGATSQTWAECFFYLLLNLSYDLQFDISRYLNPEIRKSSRNPVFDKLYSDIPIYMKILAQAGIPYIFWALLAGLKIWVPRMEKEAKNKETKLLKSLVDHQTAHENLEINTLDIPLSEDEFTLLNQH